MAVEVGVDKGGSTMIAPDIELTEAEKALFAQLTFDFDELDEPGRYKQNGDAVCALIDSLMKRNGIPAHRVNWFTDPDYNIGGHGKSRMQVFEGNGCRGEAILRHAHFLAHLRYFICGPELPNGVADTFRKAVEDCGHVTSSDVLPLGKLARDLARKHRLKSSDADEFYKLALDCGLNTNYARHIRDDVKKLR